MAWSEHSALVCVIPGWACVARFSRKEEIRENEKRARNEADMWNKRVYTQQVTPRQREPKLRTMAASSSSRRDVPSNGFCELYTRANTTTAITFHRASTNTETKKQNKNEPNLTMVTPLTNHVLHRKRAAKTWQKSSQVINAMIVQNRSQ